MRGKEKLDVRVPSEYEELKKLLMRRAIHTIPILLSLQNEGNSIERLYKRGMLTDNMHFHVKELKAFVDKEFQDIQFEADDLVEGWGQQIWPQAMQFHQVKYPMPLSVADLIFLHGLQMILKQAEEKSEEQRAAEEEKKRLKKEKEKAKKAVTKEDALAKEPVVAEDPEVVKQREAERMAQLLLEVTLTSNRLYTRSILF